MRLNELGLGIVLVAACSDPGGSNVTGEASTGQASATSDASSTTVTPPDSTPTTTSPGSATEPDPSTTGDESSGTRGLPMNDVFYVPDMPIPSEEGCQAIDFLFVIDDSGSMYDEQINLIANFPTFSEQIQSTLEHVTSYQVGVVATDAYPYNDEPCGALGDLVISTEGGSDSSNMVCGPYAAGQNFMTQEDDLAASFACAAQLGTYGDGIERPMEAMMNTLSDQNDGPGECNEDFIRDDALLVVVIITDEWDGPNDPEGAGSHSIGDPDVWYEAVLEAKGGVAENAAVLALINYEATEDMEPSLCTPLDDYSDGVNIRDFTLKFEQNGFIGGLCLDDFGPIFEQAIGVIDTACENFIPPN
jgi:hypothetical protein